MRGDGQVVMVQFDSYAVEVVPAFALDGGGYWICDTNGGGRYKKTHPDAEIAAVRVSNEASNNNTRDLIRMMKCWQAYCNVPMKSFQIELLVIEFLELWPYRGRSAMYYDWMTRDFFKFLIGKANGWVMVPGTFEIVWLGDEWRSRAESALGRAERACADEISYPCLAGGEWQRIYGTDIPMC